MCIRDRAYIVRQRRTDEIDQMASAKFSLRMDDELKDWLEMEAKRRDRSAGYVAVQAIQHLKDITEAKRDIIRDAMVEADKGVFVSQESMTEWFMSLETEKELPFPKPDVCVNNR
jgi:predicted transcriptional regulator